MNPILSVCRNSAFNKSSTGSTLMFRDMFKHKSLQLYTDYDDLAGDECPVKYATPEFQRSNDKWSKAQKTKFIENVLKGYRPTVMLFRMSEWGDAQIIDGLQRLTAMKEFHEGKVKAFGHTKDELYFADKRIVRGSVECEIYTFDKWEEVGKFYIEMNESITHSPEDIQKCKDWFLSEKGIQL